MKTPTLLLLIALSIALNAQAAQDRPNIVLILADDLGIKRANDSHALTAPQPFARHREQPS